MGLHRIMFMGPPQNTFCVIPLGPKLSWDNKILFNGIHPNSVTSTQSTICHCVEQRLSVYKLIDFLFHFLGQRESLTPGEIQDAEIKFVNFCKYVLGAAFVLILSISLNYLMSKDEESGGISSELFREKLILNTHARAPYIVVQILVINAEYRPLGLWLLAKSNTLYYV